MASRDRKRSFRKTFNASEQSALRTIGELIQAKLLLPEALEIRHVTASPVKEEGLHSGASIFTRSVTIKSTNHIIVVNLYTYDLRFDWESRNVSVHSNGEVRSFTKERYGADAYRWMASAT